MRKRRKKITTRNVNNKCGCTVKIQLVIWAKYILCGWMPLNSFWLYNMRKVFFDNFERSKSERRVVYYSHVVTNNFLNVCAQTTNEHILCCMSWAKGHRWAHQTTCVEFFFPSFFYFVWYNLFLFPCVFSFALLDHIQTYVKLFLINPYKYFFIFAHFIAKFLMPL